MKRSLLPGLSGGDASGRDVVYAELARDHIQTGAEFIVMRRDRDWKLVYYMGEPDGELYDLRADPGESQNLWEDAGQRSRRDALIKDVLEWSMRESLRSRMAPTLKPQQPMLIDTHGTAAAGK